MLLICLLATILQGIIALDSSFSHQKDEFTNNTIGETSIDGKIHPPINFLGFCLIMISSTSILLLCTVHTLPFGLKQYLVI